jgi:hypothetical protein
VKHSIFIIVGSFANLKVDYNCKYLHKIVLPAVIYFVICIPEYMRFGIDDEEIGRITPPAGGFYEYGNFANEGLGNPWTSGTKMAPFDRDFFLILCLAVGGNNGFFPDSAVNQGGKPWMNQTPQVI